MNNFNLQYEDTAAGAIECLKNEFTYDTIGATAIPDPYAKGVWKVTMVDKTIVIVYLKGHGNQANKTYNDSEEIGE